MDNRPQSQIRFLQILNHESEQAQSLLDLLKREYELLKSNPGKELEKLLAQKQQQMKTVEQSVLAHHRFLQQQDLSSDRRGTESYLAQCRNNPSLAEAWESYVALLQACHKQNEINGGAVTINQRQSRSAG
ncbi:MAG: flagellar protein FlgN [Candidatus Thiodiazotropha sp.]